MLCDFPEDGSSHPNPHDEKALTIYKEAYLALGGKEADLEKEMWQTRLTKAPLMTDFTAYDYEGKEVSYNTIKGKVTLLAFWFPT